MTKDSSVGSVEAQRRFFCDRCQVPVVVCTPCDRGQRYCGPDCSQAARREKQRASNRRYQSTERGRKLHNARQARYKDRQRNRLRQTATDPEVTEQGYQEAVSQPLDAKRQPARRSCMVCGAPRTEFLRLEPKARRPKTLRHHRRRVPSTGPPVNARTRRASDRQNPAGSDRR
jgi:hypothetical protein